MSLDTNLSDPRLFDWSLTIGGSLLLGVGIWLWVRGAQLFLPPHSVVLVGVSLACLGLGNLLNPSQPEASTGLTFTGKVLAGLAVFSISWALSHP